VISNEGLAGWLTSGELTQRHAAGRSELSIDDAQYVKDVQRIQRQHRGWLVMWSRWRRTFTAFSCFTPEALVVDKRTADDLISEMHRIEMHYCPTRIDSLGGIPAYSRPASGPAASRTPQAMPSYIESIIPPS
jgi:hypothetical protein